MEDNLEIHVEEVHIKENPLKGPSFNPHVRPFGWPTPNPCMFIPPWYPLPTTQLIPEPTTKFHTRSCNI